MATDVTNTGRLELLAHSEMCCELYFTLQILEVVCAGGTRNQGAGVTLGAKSEGQGKSVHRAVGPRSLPYQCQGYPHLPLCPALLLLPHQMETKFHFPDEWTGEATSSRGKKPQIEARWGLNQLIFPLPRLQQQQVAVGLLPAGGWPQRRPVC